MTAFWLKNRYLNRIFKFAPGVVPLVIIFQLTSGCFSFRMSQKEVDSYFANSALKPRISSYTIDKRRINYAGIGSDSLPTVIFFHGAPGSWTAFIDYFQSEKLLAQAELISVDRPGYGDSNFGKSQPSLQKQSEYFGQLLRKYNHSPTILVGHSLGGPVVAKLAMDYPDLVDGIIMVAPSIDPSLEPNEDWFRFPLHTPFLRWILPASFRVTNDEIYYLEDELISMLPHWKEIKAPVIVIQGGLDNLVPPGNAEFAKQQLTNSAEVELVMIDDMNHFVPWTHPELIEQAIFKQLQTKKVE